MITGVVNALLDATIRVRVSGPTGQELELEAVVDTGFSGFLTLPPGSIAELGLPWLCRELELAPPDRLHRSAAR